MIGDQRGVGGSCWAAAHRVVDDAHVAEARFLPPQPDGGGAVGHRLDAAGGQRRGAHGGRRCWTHVQKHWEDDFSAFLLLVLY